MQYNQARVIGGQGSGSDKFTATLRGICVDRQDRLYAAGDSHVKVFDAAGRILRRWGTSRPVSAVAVSGDGSVYAGEAGQIEIFDSAGNLARTWRHDGHLGDVTAIEFFGTDIFVADSKDRCILRYGKNLNLLNTIGKDNRTNGFLIPNGVLDFSIDAAGIIHSANPGKHRVERYTREGQLLGHIGRFDGLDPAGFPGCCNPTNVAVGPSGWVYVTEKAGPRAKVMDAAGQLLAVIATNVFDPNSKNMSIALDSHGRVYVADSVKLQVVVFEPAAGKAGAA